MEKIEARKFVEGIGGRLGAPCVLEAYFALTTNNIDVMRDRGGGSATRDTMSSLGLPWEGR